MIGDVVITGEGILCAIGLDKQMVRESMRNKRTGIGEMRYLNSTHRELPVGEVPLSNDDMKGLLGLTNAEYVNRSTLMGMMAVRQALEDAGIDATMVKDNGLRVVLVSGTTVAGMDVTESLFRELENSEDALECLKYHSAGTCTRMIAEDSGVFAEYTTISTACSSAANALMIGARMIEEGEADIVVAGGTEALSVFHLNGFNSLMILDHETCRPFDESRAGLNLGEGAGYVVLESEESARRRGVKGHAYLTGYGNACDAFHQTASSENGEGAYLAMTEALRTAGLKAEDIQYVNAHGTGTPNNDLSETMALKRVFGDKMPLVSSTKGYTGHTTSASGGIEAVICIMAIENRMVPGNIGWSRRMEGGIVPTMGEEDYEIMNVVCNSFGFGGNDTSLIFSKGKKVKREKGKGGKEIRIVSRVEISKEEDLAEIREYVKPMEARRMCKIMKSSLLASLKALKEAGIEKPDAIITGTAMGCMENSEQLLLQLINEGEGMLKPTWFMQSTHNTISSNIAIRLGCHGYNVTYTQDENSLDWAMRDARRLLESGECRTVLVGCHDETTPYYRKMMARLGYDDLPSVRSVSMVMTIDTE